MRACATTLESELTNNELQFLLSSIGSDPKPGKHLEIGTAAGGTLWEMLRSFNDSNRPPFVVVDPMNYFPDQFRTVCENLKQHECDLDWVDFKISKSADSFVEAESNNERFDVIFIDGNHKIRYVTKDLRWSRLLNPNGLLLLHDYKPQFPGVWRSVNRFLNKYPHYSVIGQVENLVAIRKTGESFLKEVSAIDIIWANIWHPIYNLGASIKKRLHK
jgi:hypothetical protein